MTRIRPVILCGGDGRRLWPLSSPAKPKPFHCLHGEQTLFQDTLQRFRGALFLAPVVVCAVDHVETVKRQAEAIDVRLHALVAESAPNGTLNAALLGTLAAGDDDVCLVTPADHIVDRPEALIEAIAVGAEAAGRLVLLGARPDRAHSGMGHILPSPAHAAGPRDVAAFVEKPGLDRSADLIADGALWNMGLVLAPARSFSDAARLWTPESSSECRDAFRGARVQGNLIHVGDLPTAAEPSLDRAILERAANLCVVECDAGWRDVGCWQSIWDEADHDRSRNLLRGPSQVIDATGCVVWTTTLPVSVIGLKDVIVVSTDQGVLVMSRDRAQDVGMLKH